MKILNEVVKPVKDDNYLLELFNILDVEDEKEDGSEQVIKETRGEIAAYLEGVEFLNGRYASISRFKRIGELLGVEIVRALMKSKDDAEALEEELSNMIGKELGKHLKKHIEKFIVKTKEKVIERELNPKTNRMNKVTKINIIKTINKDEVYSFCMSSGKRRARIANSVFRYAKKCILHREQVNKIVGKDNPYVGERSVNIREKQLEGHDRYLNKQYIEVENKRIYLSEIKKGAHQKFSETYIQIKGFEKIADMQSMTFLFVTITAPSRFHPNPSKGRSSFDGSRGADTMEWFTGIWSRLRNQIQRENYNHLKFGINSGFGFRVIEPHKDGCPHWHILLFCKEDLVQEYSHLFNSYFGHSESAVKIMEKGIDKDGNKMTEEKKASASSYIAKYLMKHSGEHVLGGAETISIDGTRESMDEFKDIIARHDTWRSIMEARSFIPFGVCGKKTLYDKIVKIDRSEKKGKQKRNFDEKTFLKMIFSDDEIEKMEKASASASGDFESEIPSDELYYKKTYSEIAKMIENESIKTKALIKRAVKYNKSQNKLFEEVKRVVTEKKINSQGVEVNNINYAKFIMKSMKLNHKKKCELKEVKRKAVIHRCSKVDIISEQRTREFKESEVGLIVGFEAIFYEKFEVHTERCRGPLFKGNRQEEATKEIELDSSGKDKESKADTAIVEEEKDTKEIIKEKTIPDWEGQLIELMEPSEREKYRGEISVSYFIQKTLDTVNHNCPSSSSQANYQKPETERKKNKAIDDTLLWFNNHSRGNVKKGN